MNYGLVNKPKHPGATRRVWEIADEITAHHGKPARRKDVIDAYVAEGGNANTASTQYYYWKVAQSEPSEPAGNPGRPPAPVRLRVETDGVLRLTPDILRALGIGEGDVLVARVEDGELQLRSPDAALRRIQAIARKYKKPGQSVVDDFLAERRAMWGEE